MTKLWDKTIELWGLFVVFIGYYVTELIEYITKGKHNDLDYKQ